MLIINQSISYTNKTININKSLAIRARYIHFNKTTRTIEGQSQFAQNGFQVQRHFYSTPYGITT